MKPGPRGMEPSRNGDKGAGGTATRLRATRARLRATRPCGMKPGPCSMEPDRKSETIALGACDPASYQKGSASCHKALWHEAGLLWHGA
eukprot:7133181-Karenia_brevis.AAC.1